VAESTAEQKDSRFRNQGKLLRRLETRFLEPPENDCLSPVIEI
jgi:hypothetical protein